MDLKVYPSKLKGDISIIPSKSQAHRLLICAAFANDPTELYCADTNQDIEATVSCLRSIGAKIERTDLGYVVYPVKLIPKSAELDCGESGSTLRFLLPIVCALGIEASIHMSGRLPFRPLSPLWEELERMGCKLSRPTQSIINVSGCLQSGEYNIAGSVSSQFISGLLFALSLITGVSHINITGKLESRPYVKMTQQALETFGVDTKDFTVVGSRPFISPGKVIVEGDWSNGAFFLTAAALGHDITVQNLNKNSVQGDRQITSILESVSPCPVISAADIPDLIPILAVYFSTKQGATFTNIARLRLKESDRVQSVTDLLESMGIRVTSDENTMTVCGGSFTGGLINTCGDHRIAMAAGIAATLSDAPVIICGAECVAKSYPKFWEEYRRLGGKYEQYIW